MKTPKTKTVWPHTDEPIVKCRKCPQMVFFKKMVSGKWMPIEADGEHEGESHFAYCKFADTFRKPEQGKLL